VIKGSDAVMSALGPRGAKSAGLLAGAAANIVAAMAQADIRRLFGVSAAGAFIEADPDTGALVKLILPRILAGQFADVRRMEDVVRASGLDWTLVRATRLVDGPPTGQYRAQSDFRPSAAGRSPVPTSRSSWSTRSASTAGSAPRPRSHSRESPSAPVSHSYRPVRWNLTRPWQVVA
jgi:putative NADH-flavin reductase